ncbi:MAG: ABC transporter permease [Lachnospirales bacterium]
MKNNTFVYLLGSLFIGLLVGAIFFIASGYDPIGAYIAIFKGAFGSLPAVMLTLTQSTPLMFTGLAYAIAFKCGVINIGTEGQLYVGGFFAAIAGIYIQAPDYLILPICLLAAIIGGGVWALIIAILKVRFSANEVISSIMLNSIAVGLCGYLLTEFFTEEGSWSSQSATINVAAQLPRFDSRFQTSFAVVIAIVVCIFTQIMLKRMVLGYEIRAIGQNKIAAETAGIKSGKIILFSMFLSGAIAGLGGAGQILGVDYRFVENFSNGYGFDGVAVAALAYCNPIGVIFTSILFGALRAGAMTLNRVAKIPMDFVTVIQAVIVVSVAAPLLVKQILEFIPNIIKRFGNVKEAK